MPYRYTTFDGVGLPEYLPEDDLGVGSIPSTLLDSLGGVFDYLGTTRRLPKRHPIHYRGKFVGRGNTRWIDEDGNFVVDELGNYIILGADYAADLRDQVDSLKAKIGVYAQLIREREEDGMQQFKLTRLLGVSHVRRVEDVDRVAVLDLDFEAAGFPWKKSTATTTTDSLASGANVVAVTVAGVEQVRDAVITVTATSNITNLLFELGSNTKFTFAGTVLAGNDLVIDMGKLTVKNDGVDAYTNFVLDAIHTVDGWLVLPNGTNNMTVTVTGGPGSISIEHYDQWM